MSAVPILTSRAAVRARFSGPPPGLVPTMGALHAGHAALIERSAAENAETVVSVFVNPTQFTDAADLANYPRTIERDAAIAAASGATAIFAPPATEVYPTGFATTVSVAGLAGRWEGAARPGHFDGVATVVAILLNAVRPARSYFGEKDFQQLLVVRRMHHDLALPGEIVACETVRDIDGLALSSRNQRLSPGDRALAAAFPAALFAVRALAASGETSAETLEATGRTLLAEVPEMSVDYLAVVDGRTLDPVPRLVPDARLLAAVRLGGVRLLDNLPIGSAS